MHGLSSSKTRFILAVGLAFGLTAAGTTTMAETARVRIAQQIGLQNLPVPVMVEKKLIEKHAKAMGLDNVEVSLAKLGSGAATNDALLSGSIDLVAAAAGPLLKIWDKTRGSIDVRGVAALVSLPMLLNTNQPHIKSLKDFKETDRIALPAVKVSVNAVVLQMASEKLYGDPYRMDPMTVSMKHPDAMAALLSGRSHITAHFTVPPFSYMEAKDPKVHTVTNSFDILGGPHTQFSLYTTKRYRDENPVLFKAIYAALQEAVDIINQDKRAAAELYVKFDQSGMDVDFVEEMIRKPEVTYTTTPQNMMKFAQFMHRIGAIKNMPKSWKDLYWEEAHGEPGS